MAEEKNPTLAVAKLSEPLTKQEVEDACDLEQNLVPGSKPYLDFDVHGNIVSRRISTVHTVAKSTDEVKRPFLIALHRKYPKIKVEWLDGPMSPLRLA